MKSLKVRFTAMLSAALLVAAAMVVMSHDARAQFFQQSYPPGFAAAGSNPSAWTVASLTSNVGALSVTNPAVNGIINVEAGQVFCFNGAIDSVGRTQISLVLPSSGTTTYLIVYNCVQNAIYSKTAVTGPGTVTGTQGTPQTILAPIPSLEIPLATVVCSTTACGNGSGSITDARPVGAFTTSHITSPSTNADIVGTATLVAGTKAITFTNAYVAAPVCIVTWNGTGTLTAGASLKCVATTSGITITSSTGTDTAVINYLVYGFPN